MFKPSGTFLRKETALSADHRPAKKPEIAATQSHWFKHVIWASVSIFLLYLIIEFLLPLVSNPPQYQEHSAGNLIASNPVLLVLPFENLSQDLEKEYFADGITEDIVTALSRVSNLRVLAINSSYRFKNLDVSPKDLGRELNISHILHGSVRQSGERLRISARLISTQSEHLVWAERYDRRLIDVFSVQDDVTQNIVNALSVNLTDEDREHLGQIAANNFAAYDAFLRGQRLIKIREYEQNLEAQKAYREAIAQDPFYARSYGALAYAMIITIIEGWSETSTEDKARALELARKGVSLDKNSHQAFWSLSVTHLFRKEFDEALKVVDKALEIAPNYADGIGLQAFIHAYLGNGEEAARLMSEAMKLNPHYAWDYPYILGWAFYIQQEYERAIGYLEKALQQNPNAIPARLILAASYSAVNRLEDAEWQVQEISWHNPRISLRLISEDYPINDSRQLQELLNRLRSAGLSQ